jgi:membrane-associated phospholipid phosphatase
MELSDWIEPMLAQLFSWDTSLFQAVNGFAGDWTLDRIVNFTQSNYLLRCVPFLAPLWYFWFQPGNRQNERRDAIICLIFGLLVALVVNRALASFLPFRVRPMYTDGIDFHPMSLTSNPNMVGWSSFPSDNATFYFAAATGIYFMCRALGTYLIAHAVVFVCLPRVYEGIHYPSDIIVGAAIGVVVMIPVMTMPLTRRLFFCQYIRNWAGMHGGLFAMLFFAATFEMVVLYDDVREVLIGVAHFLHAKGMIARVESTIFILGSTCLAVMAASASIYYRYLRPLPSWRPAPPSTTDTFVVNKRGPTER